MKGKFKVKIKGKFSRKEYVKWILESATIQRAKQFNENRDKISVKLEREILKKRIPETSLNINIYMNLEKKI